ncbi:MFS transporter [Paenibacillus aurantius]|uniref:MFS transporter n=1 Tax=Paenibacillus aurantius TaxID=2918900 RepID=A0AA96L950_9BACL|nr:MFS transporter [Paenibacillus aurantius]WNQ08813.1 MFS transporter [Paenibacillus aurantius]
MTYSKRWGILQIINMGTLMSTLDVGIVNIAMPTMADQFGRPLSQIQWVATLYLLTMVTLLPFLGKFSDQWNRRRVYSWGFLLFSAGSLCIALSDGLAEVLLSRVLQGVGATMIMANSQAMVRQIFPDHERGRALGINAIVISMGTLSGPAVGGFLLHYVTWPWLFAINVPIGLVAFGLGLRWFPDTESTGKKGSFDLPGSVLLGAGTCLLMLAAEGSQASGWMSPVVIGEAAAGALLFVGLWLHERRIENGILDRELFGNRAVLFGNAGSFLINLAQMATIIPITFYLQGQLGLSVQSAGLLLILQPLLMGTIAPFAGWFRDRYGAFFPVMAGSICCAFSMLFVMLAPEAHVWIIGLQLAWFGVGMGLFHSTNNAEIMSAAPSSKSSLAGSMLALVRYLGQIAGIGLATLLVGTWGLTPSTGSGIDVPMRILFGLCLISCIGVTLLTLSLKRGKRREPSRNLSPRDLGSGR